MAENLRKNYGMSLADYEEMVFVQGGKCAICHEEKTLVVDHNHSTGKIRSLLCHGCNKSIGLMKENPLFLQEAAEYLLKYGALDNQ